MRVPKQPKRHRRMTVYEIFGGWAPLPGLESDCSKLAAGNDAKKKGASCNCLDGVKRPCTAIPCSQVSTLPGLDKCEGDCGWSADYADCLWRNCTNKLGAAPTVAKGASDAVTGAVNAALGPISAFFQPCKLGKDKNDPNKPLIELPFPCWFGGLLTVLILLVLIRH